MVYNDNTLLHEHCLLSELGFGDVCDRKSKYSGQVKCLKGHQDTSVVISTALPDSGRLTGMRRMQCIVGSLYAVYTAAISLVLCKIMRVNC